jgi:hypothetical protein
VNLQGKEDRNHYKDGFRFTARFCRAATSLIDGSDDMPDVVQTHSEDY